MSGKKTRHLRFVETVSSPKESLRFHFLIKNNEMVNCAKHDKDQTRQKSLAGRPCGAGAMSKVPR